MYVSLLCLLLLSPQLVDRTKEFEQPQADASELSPEKRADIFMARKMYREAAESYQEALRGEPKQARLHNKLGISYHQQMNFRQARRSYQQASKLDKKYAQAINNLGTVYYAQGNYKKAQKQYQKALKITPSSASIYSNLGTAFFARRKYKKASASYMTALKLDPDVFERRSEGGTLLQERSVRDRARYHYFMAQAYARAEIYDRALLYLRRSLEEGYGKPAKAAKDSAFEAMREMPAFQALVNPEARPS